MKIQIIYIIKESKFGGIIHGWAKSRGIEVNETALKSSGLIDSIDTAVLFHENHNFSKENLDIQKFLIKNNKMIHKVDINGTLSATQSNYTMWLDQNRPQSMLFLGDDEIIKNPNLNRFLKGIEK